MPDWRALFQIAFSQGGYFRTAQAAAAGDLTAEVEVQGADDMGRLGGALAKMMGDLKNVIGPPKSEAGHRTIPLPSSAINALTAWKLACPPTDQDIVFPSLAKRVMSHQYMNVNIMGAIQIAAGITDPVVKDGKLALDKEQQPIMAQRYTLHDFRHAAASLWIEQRVNPKRVQKWMGHSSIQVTFDTYGHLFDQADQDNAIAAAIEMEILGR